MADVERERVTALWREAAALESDNDVLIQAREKIARAHEQGGPLLEAIVRGHGCCMVNDPEYDQALWDEALAECGRLREQLDAARHLARVNAAGFDEHEERADRLQDECGRLREQLDAARQALAVYADPRHWGIMRDEFRHPSAVWIGPGADDKYPNAPGIARAALGVEGEQEKP